jgi:hypothetical protein
MPTRFIPCAACARHVREGDAACPFCGATAPVAPALSRAAGRLSRSAFLALGAAGALSATGCSSTSTPSPQPLYGSPPLVDAGSLADVEVPLDAESDGGFAQPLYGATAPPVTDAGGEDAEPPEGGGHMVQPLYGAMAVPRDGGQP